MWLLDWLPFWIFHLIILAGIVGLFVAQFIKFIPFVNKYRLFLQIGSIVVLALGLYMEGGISNQKKWEARIKEMELRIAEAENHSVQENVRIEKKVVTKIEVVKQRGEDIVKYIDREITKYDNTCVIPKEFVKAHNDAAEAPK